MTNKIGDNTRKEYYDTVKGIAEEIAEAVQSGEIGEDDIYDRVHEDVDGNYWVIYTHASYAVWMFSDNNSAIDEAVDDGSFSYDQVTDFSQALTMMAFFALKADVEAKLSELLED